MSLPLRPPYAPMEARLVDEIPAGPGWQYEPKWDGFRCLAFRDDDVQSGVFGTRGIEEDDPIGALVCLLDKQRFHPHRSAESFLDCDAEFRHNQGEILAAVIGQTNRECLWYLAAF